MFDFESQKDRSFMYKSIREFFDKRGYLEVFTPTLSDNLIPEPTIECFKSEFINEFLKNKDLFLIPSPEVFMKELLSAGSGSIYQISSCFRNCEQISKIHNPEFSMLEYYTVDYDEMDSINLTNELLYAIKREKTPKYASPPMRVLSVSDAFKEYAKCDLETLQDVEALRSKVRELGLSVNDDEEWDDAFNRIFITFVEPNLPKDKPICLTDYPYQIDCLAEKYPDKPYRHRWEMYINGVEVANCYKEERDINEIKAYYEREEDKLKRLRSITNTPIAAISSTFSSLIIPPSSGVAIGLDRLLMCISGKEDITPLLLFPLSDMIAK